MTTTYEWDIETCAVEAGEVEIIDHDHRDKISEWPMELLLRAINQETEPGNQFTRLVLVRDSDRDGRSWAYVTDDGEMPEKMLDAYDRPVCDVPKRYREEFAR